MKKEDKILNDLKEYFKNTPKEQIQKDWEETKRFDKVGPTVAEFINSFPKIINPPIVQFETTKKHCLFVMLPDGAWNTQIFNNEVNQPCLGYAFQNDGDYIELPKRDWKLQGFVSELTDEQKEGVVDISQKGWFTNCVEGWFQEDFTASESFASLLTSLNVLLVNPYKFPCTIDHEFYDEPYDGTGFYQELYSGAMERWQTAQQHVGNWVLLTANK